MFCLHSLEHGHIPEEVNDARTLGVSCDTHKEQCCYNELREDCLDVKIDGLDLDFSFEQLKVATSAVLATSKDYTESWIHSLGAQNPKRLAQRAPPNEFGLRLHLSVPTTVLRI